MAHVRLPFRGCHSADTVRSLDIPRHTNAAVLWGKNSNCYQDQSMSSVSSQKLSRWTLGKGHGMTFAIDGEPGWSGDVRDKIRVSTMTVCELNPRLVIGSICFPVTQYSVTARASIRRKLKCSPRFPFNKIRNSSESIFYHVLCGNLC